MKNTHARKNRRLMPVLASLVVVIGLGWGADARAQVVKGSGTTNDIPVWTTSTTIGNSIMSQSGSNVNVTGGVVATTLSGNGSGVTNVNALTLGGLGSGAFAQLGAANTFAANQAINGTLTLSGSLNNALILQGNLISTNGNTSANVIGGFTGNSAFAGNSVASGVAGATIAGGGGGSDTASPNTVTADYGTVSGGLGNTASGAGGTVAGGSTNTAGNLFATVSGGALNVANGSYATVPGGTNNAANGQNSFAAGYLAVANNIGSFVWSDSSSYGSYQALPDTGPNSFVARASGGFTFYTAAGTSTGATLPSGSGSWSTLSDRDAKANFNGVDGQAVLSRLAALPIATWNYKAQPDSVRHMGPTAQDFREAFGLGEDEKHISTVDAQGVALAAIQALYETVTELKSEVADKDQQIVEMRARLAHLEQRQ